MGGNQSSAERHHHVAESRDQQQQPMVGAQNANTAHVTQSTDYFSSSAHSNTQSGHMTPENNEKSVPQTVCDDIEFTIGGNLLLTSKADGITKHNFQFSTFDESKYKYDFSLERSVLNKSKYQ